MQCKKCGYRLWNLPSRVCPECGTPFSPSDYEFVINSVQFCCPHCQERYYGTSDKGHLVPIAFDCASCGQRIHMDEMILLPTVGVEEEQTQPDKMPWLDRRQRGLVGGWWSTVGMALFHPVRLMQCTPESSPGREAWSFALVTNMLAVPLGCTLFGLMSLAGVFIATGGTSVSMALVGVGIGLAAGLVFAAVGVLVIIAVWGWIAHSLLRLTGAVSGRLGRTYQAICYSSGANIVTALPVLGIYLGWVWWVVSAVLMVRTAQRVEGWRAAVAVLFLPALPFAALVGLYVYLAFAGIAQVAANMSGTFPRDAEVRATAEAVLAYAQQNKGRGPRHAVELVAEGYLAASDLVSDGSATRESGVPVTTVTLLQFEALSGVDQAEVAEAAAAALPDQVTAHRLGDFVFVHHGIDMSQCDPRLWIVVLCLDPDVNPAPTAIRGSIRVGQCDGAVRMIPASSLSNTLAEQNALRAEFALPPIPDPRTITHSEPAEEEMGRWNGSPDA